MSLSREAIIDLLEGYLVDRDEAVFLSAISIMITPDDSDTFAIMQGSGNEMSPFDQFLHLSKQRGFLFPKEGIAYIQKFYATAEKSA